jgi:outer membrane lipoprotein-sorting protein
MRTTLIDWFSAKQTLVNSSGETTMEILTTRTRGVKAKSLLAFFVLAFVALSGRAQETSAPETADDPVARSIVEKADQVRFPAEGFQVDINITSSQPGQANELRKYRVLSKGNSNTVVMLTEPAAERGQIILMKGRDLWVFMPDVSQPVRLSLAQRLTGQVANGDLARANFASDYHPRILRSETIGNDDYHVLELTAVDRGVTYQKVVYWVRQKDNWPFKAEFYSLSNRLLKTCKYENYQLMEGRQRPTRLVMEDALKSGNQSILEYSSMKLRDLPDKVFTKDYLKKLE